MRFLQIYMKSSKRSKFEYVCKINKKHLIEILRNNIEIRKIIKNLLTLKNIILLN